MIVKIGEKRKRVKLHGNWNRALKAIGLPFGERVSAADRAKRMGVRQCEVARLVGIARSTKGL